jgi:hypothetical protein
LWRVFGLARLVFASAQVECSDAFALLLAIAPDGRCYIVGPSAG